MATPLRVLFIEDSDDDTMLQVRLLSQGGYVVSNERVETSAALSEALERKWDIIISDYSMPHFKGTDALKLVRQKGQDVPFIFVSGTIGEDAAVAALKVGAHDFNNVIGAIMGWADLGVQAAIPGSDLQDKFLKIRSQADRASALTRQLLAFARRQVLQSCNTNLNELTTEAISLLRNVIGERIEIHMELAEDLWIVWADPGQIEQVLMNLCLNSRDAMPNGGRL